MQGRRNAVEVPAAEITAQHTQCEGGEGSAERDAGDAADHAQHQRFDQHQLQAAARRQPQHAEQRELLRAFGHAESEHREDQKRACEKRDQRQHREVDAVGARQVAHTFGRIARLGDADASRPVRRAFQ